MRIAFHAPLKPPDHPVASGDRQMARNLMAALERGLGGPVWLASRLRTRDGAGDEAVQAALVAEAKAEIARLTPLRGDTALWVTYHSYYKAPDLVGPAVARAWGVPYVLIEATRAKRRLTGRWAGFAARAEAACDAAQVIFHLTEQDAEALRRDRATGQEIVALPPFLARDTLPPVAGSDGPILIVGMMREGDKLASYRLAAGALALLPDTDWQAEIAGDGPARAEVATLMAPFGDRVRFLGALDAAALEAAYARAGLFLWPGVNEAFGMVYLEAQAAGLAVVAQDRPGVRDVLLAGDHPAQDEGAEGLARALARLLADAPARRAQGAAARARIAQDHLLPAAAARLRDVLAPLTGGCQ